MQHNYKIKQLQTAFEDGSQGITLIIEDITAQITYQKMLELNEAKYRGIVEDQTEFITRFLPDGTLVFVNDAYARYLGKNKEDLLGGPHIPDIDPDSIAGVTQCIQSLDIENPVQSCECSIHHSCGKNRSNLWTIRAFFDDTQKPIEYQGIGRDNTEKHEAATRINQYIRDLEFLSRKSQEFVEISAGADIFQAIAQGLSEIIPDSLITVNSIDTASDTLTVRAVLPERDRGTFKKYLGKDLLGFRFNTSMLPEEKKTDFLSIQIAGKLVHVIEDLHTIFFHQIPRDACDMIKKDLNLGASIYDIGLTRHGILFGSVVFAPRKGENITNLSIIETFIRQSSIVLHRRLTDDALKTSESRYRGIVEDQTEFITRFLPDGTLIFVNDAYARYLGKKKEDLIGGPHIPEIDCDDITTVNQHIQSLDIQNPVQSFKCSIHHSCGKVRSNQWTVRAIFDDTQKPVEYQGVGKDNTEKREAATKISQHIRDMEFLSRKAQEFVALSSEADIFNTIGQGLSELVPRAVIVVDSYDQRSESLTVRTVFSDTDRQILSTCVGQECEGFRISLRTVPAPLKTFALSLLLEGKLFHTDESLYNFLFQQVPVDICNCIKETLNLGDRYYGIGLVRQGILFGVVILLLRKGETLTNSSLIETYIHQASIVLHRMVFEDALRKSESQDRGIVEDQTEFVTRFLPDGTLTYVNDSVCRYFQKERAELLGQSIFFLIPQDDKDDLILNLHSLNAQNPVRTVEHRVFDPSGSIRWTQWTNRALFDDKGTIIEYQGVGRDITEQKEADAKIRQYIADIEFLSKKAYEFLELSPDADIYETICRGVKDILPKVIVLVNSIDLKTECATTESVLGENERAVFSKLMGEDIIGTVVTLPTNTDREIVIKTIMSGRLIQVPGNLYIATQKHLPEAICAKIEETLNIGDIYAIGLVSQSIILANVVIMLPKGDSFKQGNLIEAYIRQAANALLRRKTAETLQESEKLYRSVIENIQDVFYRSDKEGNLIMASGGWSKMLGYDYPEECLGHNIAEKFYFEPERRKEVLDAIYKNGSISDYEIVLKSRDGNPVYVSTTSHLYFDDAGEILGVEGILRDISERHAAAEKLPE